MYCILEGQKHTGAYEEINMPYVRLVEFQKRHRDPCKARPDDFFVYFELITIDIYSQCLQIQIPYPAEH